ncbi:type II secretion system minor pseudopilin GspJ [Sphingomonas adhaesiva]|uniref:type II secretion system minor pseudopilin GspJ n=1 Tax=Sphingomonas adhaesiva TaxID=28212 RepID=UPI002FF7DC23
MRRANGFTLVEVMIALMIFGMIAAAGVALLSFSVKAQGATAVALDDTGALNRLSSILTADLAQAQDRPTRDVRGVRLPAFSGDAMATPMLRLVRAGWSNPDAAPRATLQKVEYRLNAGALERVAYPALDGAPSLPPAVLLERVRGVRWRFRFAGAWSDTWNGNPRAALPQAVEMVVTRADGTTLRLLFLVGTSAVRPRAIPTAAPTAGPTNAPA